MVKVEDCYVVVEMSLEGDMTPTVTISSVSHIDIISHLKMHTGRYYFRILKSVSSA